MKSKSNNKNNNNSNEKKSKIYFCKVEVDKTAQSLCCLPKTMIKYYDELMDFHLQKKE
jgi:hypothetical protein